jgi:hypothetical protein
VSLRPSKVVPDLLEFNGLQRALVCPTDWSSHFFQIIFVDGFLELAGQKKSGLAKKV